MMNARPKILKSWRWHLALAAVLSMGLVAGCSDDEDTDNNQPTEDAGHTDGTSEDASDAGDIVELTGVQIPGLSAPVKVQFDASGVLHIDCMTDRDCYAAQGYYHANSRFFEMDLIRRQTRGELSQLLGSLGMSMDEQFRLLNTTADGVPLEEAYYDATGDNAKDMLQAYASGVNAWLGDMRAEKNGATLTAEYDHALLSGVEIRDWEPQDTIALYLQLAYQLGETASDDLFRGEMATLLSPDVAADLFSVKPGVASDIIPASETPNPNLLKSDLATPQDAAAMARIRTRLAPAASAMAKARKRLAEHHSFVFGPKNGEDGSNNWALAPSRTKDGKALLANDPHLSLNTPAIWYYVELDSKTNGNGNLHVVGASIPAVPGVIVGHNEEIAWGVTTARMDLADAYVEELSADGKSVIFEGNEVPIVEKDFTFKVKNGADQTVTFEYVPHHGPIIERDDENNVAISIRWVLQEPGNDLDFIENLMTATTTQEAMDSLEPVRAINQNWVIADRAGNIGWNPKVAIPNRLPWVDADTPNWLPLPGDGSAEWDGYVAAADAPTLYNPPSGFIATANNDMDGSYTDGDSTNDGHTPWQTVPAAGHRHKRIVDMIEAGGNEHTVETMNEIQADTKILHAEVLVPHLLTIASAASDLDAKTQSVVDALTNWEYTCPTGLVGEGLAGKAPKAASNSTDPFDTKESIGCAAFHVLLPYLTEAIFDDEVNETVPGGESENFDVLANWTKFQSALIYIFDAPGELNRGTDYFDNVKTTEVESADEIVLEQLASTADRLNALFAGLVDKTSAEVVPDDWRWGRIHTVNLVSLVSLGGFTIAQEGPYVNDGGFYSVDVANPMGREGDFNGGFSHPHGASLRAIYEVSEDGIEGVFQLPGGQDHHKDSPFYNSLLDDWLENKNTKLLFDRGEVDQAAVETITVQPAP